MDMERIGNLRFAAFFLLVLLISCSSPKQPEPKLKGWERPYVVGGKKYIPQRSAEGFQQVGWASWYGKHFHGRRTSSGEKYDMHKLTGAHKTLPMGTYVKVRRLDNGREVVVRINDRGPFKKGRVIDVSYAAAKQLDMFRKGVVRVRVEALNHSAAPVASAAVATSPTSGKAALDKTSHKDTESLAAKSIAHAEKKALPQKKSSTPKEKAARMETAHHHVSGHAVSSRKTVGEAGNAKSPGSIPAVSGGGYTVQVGVFSVHDNAQRLAAKLRSQGNDVRVKEHTNGSTRHYAVWVGRYASRAAAEEARRTLARGGNSGLVVQIK
ncbi:MAG: septal ring lytic transglycosylase RlpA family protein [Deltaproteobacteria bacterium]|nr:septal ring lytic transglycosylase RlpA family protein [Deltaproteobacteria bacterium]